MASRKKIKIKCYSGISIDPTYRVPWDDLFLSTNYRRKILKLAPCLISKSGLRSDLETSQFCLDNIGKKYTSDEIKNPFLLELFNDANDEKYRDKTIEDYNYYLDLLNRIDNEKYIINAAPGPIHNLGRNFILANVYTSAEYVDKKEAETMLNVYLSKIGLKNLKYNWIRPTFFITPT